MSPRRPAALRDASAGVSLRDHLIATAARLIDERAGETLTVRDIAREARVADGVLYNHFGDKDELLAYALATHIHSVMGTLGDLPVPGAATVEENLRVYITRGLGVLTRILPAFGSLLTQAGVMGHVREMMRGGGGGDGGLPDLLAQYLAGERDLGRVDAAVDPAAAATLIIGACHELVLPRVLLDPTAPPPQVPDDFVDKLTDTVMHGIGPRPKRRRVSPPARSAGSAPR